MPKISSSRYLGQAGWNDVSRLAEAAKAEVLGSTEPHLKDVRAKGVPLLGAGAIYRLGLEEVPVEPFSIPRYWSRVYGLDVGWNRTAAV